MKSNSKILSLVKMHIKLKVYQIDDEKYTIISEITELKIVWTWIISFLNISIDAASHGLYIRDEW